MRNYDDELRIFLANCLKKVDYLSDLDDVILTHLAMYMVADSCDKDGVMFKAKEKEKK